VPPTRLTERGDGQAYRVDLTAGGNFADDRGNAVISFGYTKVEPVYQTRPFALFGISPDQRPRVGLIVRPSPRPRPPSTSAAATWQLNPGATALRSAV
jgi:hypothetical protein